MATNYDQLKDAGVITSDHHVSHEKAAEALNQTEVDELIRVVLKLKDAHPDDARGYLEII